MDSTFFQVFSSPKLLSLSSASLLDFLFTSLFFSAPSLLTFVFLALPNSLLASTSDWLWELFRLHEYVNVHDSHYYIPILLLYPNQIFLHVMEFKIISVNTLISFNLPAI